MPPVRIPAPDATRRMSPAEWGHWRARVERRQRVTFWGQPYIITPRLCLTVFGDGKQWIWIEPINTRPNYYVVRVDSLLDLDGWTKGHPAIHDMLETAGGILDAIEEDFGAADDDLEDAEAGENPDDYRRPFPALDDETGVAWGGYRPPPAKRRRARRAA